MGTSGDEASGASDASAPAMPVGFIGVVSPMTTLGLAPFSYLGVVYREGLVLSSAALYQVTFTRQQERIVEDLMASPFDEMSARENVHVYPSAEIDGVELRRQFAAGYRLHLIRPNREITRLIVQGRRVDEIRRVLPLMAGDRWVDTSGSDG